MFSVQMQNVFMGQQLKYFVSNWKGLNEKNRHLREKQLNNSYFQKSTTHIQIYVRT
jgi:hypothetical protein